MVSVAMFQQAGIGNFAEFIFEWSLRCLDLTRWQRSAFTVPKAVGGEGGPVRWRHVGCDGPHTTQSRNLSSCAAALCLADTRHTTSSRVHLLCRSLYDKTRPPLFKFHKTIANLNATTTDTPCSQKVYTKCSQHSNKQPDFQRAGPTSKAASPGLVDPTQFPSSSCGSGGFSQNAPARRRAASA